MKTGRPTKLDTPRSETIVAAIRRGSPMESAAAQSGISRRSLYGWLRRGCRAIEAAETTGDPVPDDERPFVDFYVEAMAALADWETGRLEKIADAAENRQHWTAAAWLLERRMPEKYALKTRVDHRHRVSLEVADVSDVVPEVLDWTEESEDPDPSLPPPRDNGNTKGAPPG